MCIGMDVTRDCITVGLYKGEGVTKICLEWVCHYGVRALGGVCTRQMGDKGSVWAGDSVGASGATV